VTEREASEGLLKPRRLIAELRAAMPEDAMLFVDSGNAILWGTHYFEVCRPDTYFIDLGLSAMGSAVAGVVGGAMAAPNRRAVALVATRRSRCTDLKYIPQSRSACRSSGSF